MTEHSRKVCEPYIKLKCERCQLSGMDCIYEALYQCSVCGGAEGSLPTECPGQVMTNGVEDAVFAGWLDFKDGQWVIDRNQMSEEEYTNVSQSLAEFLAQTK